jgi:hypothetical protein
METWKSAEEATIRFYEEVDLFQRGVVVPNPDSQYGDDAISTTQANKRYELKTCFSTYHHAHLYSLGYDANVTAYLRLDQLMRYRREDLADQDIERLIYIDRRMLDLQRYEPLVGVKRHIDKRVKIPYDIKRTWTVTITSMEELIALRKQDKTEVSTVPEWKRQAYCNNPQWDGRLLNFPITELRTIDLTSQIRIIGEENLLEHR